VKVKRALRYNIVRLPLDMFGWEISETSGDETYELARGASNSEKAAVKQAGWAMAIIDKMSYFGPTVLTTDLLSKWSQRGERKR